jgi:hypothetical protein
MNYEPGSLVDLMPWATVTSSLMLRANDRWRPDAPRRVTCSTAILVSTYKGNYYAVTPTMVGWTLHGYISCGLRNKKS